MTDRVRIDIFSDVICPWCLIGHHRLSQAASLVPEVELELTWLPFELNPDMPLAGMDRQDYLRGKFGPERAREVYARIATVLREEGLDADTDKIERTPNTFKAHRLLYLARSAEADGAAARKLKLLLFDAYFRRGQDIGLDDVLMECAIGAGLEPDQVAHWLRSQEGEIEVRQLEARAHQIGVSGVPFFIFGNRLVVSGAQAPEVLAQAVREARSLVTK